ncbi:ADP-ribosyltransferase family protein [Methanofollis fontis]|uniref:ADP ribosyltransferase domain-containing protein n=1 Tax=Methanofollis fontis TaxID=2052832 RepID=A0A483CR86_9EURY|nr:hypothetical protein [Methanofollis fontis]TAJ45625.1 hypothetical protein CUJ86_02575 [Methanofollis fontis]
MNAPPDRTIPIIACIALLLTLALAVMAIAPVSVTGCQGARASDDASSVPDHLEQTTLLLTAPDAADRIPYRERGFSDEVEASIAWWMAPDFYDTTSEYRGYLRGTTDEQAEYAEEKQVFYTFITENLDDAINASKLHSDLLLFRGISPGLAGMVIDHAEYTDAAFASTSYDITLSLGLFASPDETGYANVLILKRHAGDHALYINEDEREYLQPRDSAWYVARTVEVEDLTVESDFPLIVNNRTSASFEGVRLIYIVEEDG